MLRPGMSLRQRQPLQVSARQTLAFRRRSPCVQRQHHVGAELRRWIAGAGSSDVQRGCSCPPLNPKPYGPAQDQDWHWQSCSSMPGS